MQAKALFKSPRTLLFARNFLKHPKMLGSVIPSSRYLIQHLITEIDFEHARCIVEYGPGVGNITQQLLTRMHPECRLIAIEMNRDFVSFLEDEIDDPRLHVMHGSAADVAKAIRRLKLDHVDYVVSGIPYSTMPISLRTRILGETRRVLHPNGAFLVYQFSNAVLPDLEANFSRVHQEFEPRNILPARLFYCRR